MLVQRVQQQFIDSADLGYQCAEALGPAVEAAVGAVLACVTGGGKVLACGQGPASGLAQWFVASCLGQLERTRPAFPALQLSLDGPAACGEGPVRQLRALGASDDVLLLVAVGEAPTAFLQVMHAAHELDMTVLALTGNGTGDAELARGLRDTDVRVGVPTARLPRLLEMHLLVLHCVCEGVEVQLLGDDDANEPEVSE
jgi:D-sedoheptulose 7-phosphate isomerase